MEHLPEAALLPFEILPPIRKCVSVPGLLMSSIEKRWLEFQYSSFSPFALELICYDLRERRTHAVTLPISRRCALEQEDVDRKIVRHYRPGSMERNGVLIQLMLGKAIELPGPRVPGTFSISREWLRIPARIMECIPVRIRELRYHSFSAYLTGLIRFDLMVGGPHTHFSGLDTDPEYLRQLDEWTVREFRARRNRTQWIDGELERLMGIQMTAKERNRELRLLADRLAGS